MKSWFLGTLVNGMGIRPIKSKTFPISKPKKKELPIKWWSLLVLIFSILLFSGSSGAVTLTGSINDPSGTGITGRLYLSLSQQASQLSTGGCGGPALLAPNIQIAFNITAGVLTTLSGGTPTIIGNDCVSPNNTYYVATAKDSQGNTLFTQAWAITVANCGSPCNVASIPVTIMPNGTLNANNGYFNNLTISGVCNGCVANSGTTGNLAYYQNPTNVGDSGLPAVQVPLLNANNTLSGNNTFSATNNFTAEQEMGAGMSTDGNSAHVESLPTPAAPSTLMDLGTAQTVTALKTFTGGIAGLGRGQVQCTSNLSSGSGTTVPWDSLSVTITTRGGLVFVYANLPASQSAGTGAFYLAQDAVLTNILALVQTYNNGQNISFSWVFAPAAGSHTYAIYGNSGGGTLSTSCAANANGQLAAVELSQ